MAALLAVLASACGGSDPQPTVVYAPAPQATQAPAAAAAYAAPAPAQQPSTYAPAGTPPQPPLQSAATYVDVRAWLTSLRVPVPVGCQQFSESRDGEAALHMLKCPNPRLNLVVLTPITLAPHLEPRLRQTALQGIVEGTLNVRGSVGTMGDIPCTLPNGQRSTCSYLSLVLEGVPLRIVVGYVPMGSPPAFVGCIQEAIHPGHIPPCPLYP